MLSTLFRQRPDSSRSQAPPQPGSLDPAAKAEIPRTQSAGSLPGWIFLPTVVLIVAILYWARQVLVPIAIAVLLTFVLTPVVDALERLRLGRILSVAIAVVFALSILLGLGWIVVLQTASLANELPQYRSNIFEKIDDLRDLKSGGALEKVEQTVEDVKSELEKNKDGTKEPAPREVVVAAEGESGFWPIPLATGPMVERLAAAGLAIALLIFMLVQREDLRNRLIRVLGYSRLTVTTKALQEAGERISRYLLAQLLLNSGFGLAVGVLLFMFGVPYALLWGFLATLLRFIPYVGPWLAAIMPTALSLAYFPGWITPLIVVAVFVLLELTTNLLLEPLFYGESAGVSEIAILTMAAFWTWLWGPIGLVLATPLTVCLVVFSKYVPEMNFVTVLLSDAPALEPHVNYYQRMLALDQDEGEEVVDEYLKNRSVAELYDQVFIPALSRAKNDRRHGLLTENDEQAVYDGTRAILEDLADRHDNTTAEDEKSEVQHVPPERFVPILGFPADGKADEVALLMLAKLFDGRRHDMDVISADMLASEMVTLVGQKQPRLVCIGAIAPAGLARARYLCKRIRSRFPEIRILAGRWSASDSFENARASLMSAGADRVAGRLLEARDQLVQLLHLEPGSGTSAPARRAV
jgi:predicted PurR-regulated permease PerM